MEKIEELISIIVPVYKVEEYIDRCVTSIVNQTYSNIEIILIDDGSPDNCPNICDLWACKDMRIKVIHKNNGGVSDARNIGLKIATGKYICFVDSDDFVSENMCEIMFDALKTQNADIVCCNMCIYKDGIIQHIKHNESILVTAEQAMKEVLTGGNITPSVTGKLFKRESLNEVMFPVGEIYEDIAVMPVIFSKCNSIYYLKKELYYYRYNSNGITKSKYSQKHSDRIIRDKQICNDILKYWPKLKKSINLYHGLGSLSSILLLAKDQDMIKSYANDYNYYMDNIRNYFFLLLLEGKLAFIDKLKLLLVRFELYSKFWRILHK